MKLMQKMEASSPNLRERFNSIGSIISECFSSTWTADPVGLRHRAASVSWAHADGIAVSRAQMTPLRLVNSCAAIQQRRRFYAYWADQPLAISTRKNPPIYARPNEILILSSSEPTEWLVSTEYETSSLIIEEDLFCQYLPQPQAVTGRRLRVPVSIHATLKGIIDAAWAISCEGLLEQAGPSLARSFLEVLAAALGSEKSIRTHDHEGPPRALEFRRSQIKTYIKQHFHDPELSVSTIADGLKLSTRYVQLALAPDEITPSEYIRTLRLEECARILADHNSLRKSISAIAFDCGFNSSSYFATEFRKHFGVSPRQYRSEALGIAGAAEGGGDCIRRAKAIPS